MAGRPGLNKRGIAQAAGELADRVGLDQITLAAVAAHLGVRTPSLYNHLDGLDGLRRELALLSLEELNRRLRTAAIGKAGSDAIDSMLHAYRAFARDRPGLYQAAVRAPAQEDREMQEASRAVIDTVRLVLEGFQLSEEDTIHVVRGFRAVGHGFAALEAAGAFGMPLETDLSYKRLIETFLRGIDALRGAAAAKVCPTDERSTTKEAHEPR